MGEYLNYIPTLLSYFIPGYLGFSILKAIIGLKPETPFTISISCVVSFVSISIIKAIQNQNVYQDHITAIELILSIALCCMVFSLIAKILHWSKAKEIMSETFNITYPNSICEDLWDPSEVNYVTLKLKSQEHKICGQLTTINENDNGECWLGLSLYEFLDDEDNTISSCANPDRTFIVNTSEIEYATFIVVERE